MKKRMLIVDDEKNVQHYLGEVFSDDYTVIVASDGEQALESIRRAKPQIVLLDQWMPGKTGLQVLRQIREEFPHLQVFMVSGELDRTCSRQAIELGACDYIDKAMARQSLQASICAA